MGSKIKKNISISSGFIASVLLFLMLLTASIQMLSIRFYSVEFNFSYAIRCQMIWSFMLGAVYCFGQGKHIAFTLLLHKFEKNRFHLVLEFIINVLVLLFMILVFFFGGVLSFMREQNIFVVYLVLPITALLISIITAIDLLEIAKKLKNGVI